MNNIIKDSILMKIEKPARYVGNELNVINKKPEDVDVRFAFCFPDVYEIGMSHLGMKILYSLINEKDRVSCERVFAPWIDMEEEMKKHNIPLFSLESKDPINKFDLVGFTLQYEMSYTNILNMLDLGNIPVLSSDRKESDPLICAGGPCACNPEPLADFFDFFMIGEGEEIIVEVLDVYLEKKKNNHSKTWFLETIAKIEGVYVPAFYDVSYNANGTLDSFKPNNQFAPVTIKKRIVRDLDNCYYPDKFVVPYIEIVHDRIMLELFRGCSRGCRFCQAGFIYRPVRERSPKKLVESAVKLLDNSGYEEISLTSLSTSDYSNLNTLTEELIPKLENKRVNISLPSLRIDSFSLNLMEKISKVRKSGMTFAPEAGTQRLRDVINKGVSEEDLLTSCSLAFNQGWNNVKLYFMLGLPTETMEDVIGISDLGQKVVNKYHEVPKEKRGKGLNVTISASYFVPKPFTPFQWEPQETKEMYLEKQKQLKGHIRNKNITFNWHTAEVSLLEAVIARGDRRIGKVILTAWQKGCKFDSWGEHFKNNVWLNAFEELGIDPAFYAYRKRSYDEILPWDHINVGVSKEFLISESEKALNGVVTPNCKQNCSDCGVICAFGGGLCD